MIFGRKTRAITRILLVEDEPLVAFDTEYLLEEKGFTIVATVDRVADAVALLGGATPVDLVLADINLADGSGLDVARAAAARGVAVLFVTGSCPVDVEGIATGCLTKPYSPRDLLAAIDVLEKAAGGKPPTRLPPGMRLFNPA